MPQKRFSGEVSLHLAPTTSLGEALQAFEQTDAEALPVVKNGSYIGVLTRDDALRYAPSPANSLSKWELNYLLEQTSIEHEKLIKSAPSADFSTALRQRVELLSSGESPVLAITEEGRFIRLQSWRELMRDILGKDSEDNLRSLLQPSEFAMSM